MFNNAKRVKQYFCRCKLNLIEIRNPNSLYVFPTTQILYGIIRFLREPDFHILLDQPLSREGANCEKNNFLNYIGHFYPSIWSLGWR